MLPESGRLEVMGALVLGVLVLPPNDELVRSRKLPPKKDGFTGKRKSVFHSPIAR